MTVPAAATPLWHGRQMVVCVGTGGVGKTTVSSAIAVAAAAAGKRTLVMTIDPAQRLADALQLDISGHTEHQVPVGHLRTHGIDVQAPLWALLPQVQSTFDGLVQRLVASTAQREAILRNRFYKYFVTSLPGAHEYAAVEKLCEVHDSGRFDLIVLDTPPAQSAVDFFDAPKRVTDFFENETLEWLLSLEKHAGPWSRPLFGLGRLVSRKILDALAGVEAIRELTQFIAVLQPMYAGFAQRAQQVSRLLQSDAAAFVLVTSAKTRQPHGAQALAATLRVRGLKLDALVLNRVQPWPALLNDETKTRQALAAMLTLTPESAAHIDQVLTYERALARAEAARCAAWRQIHAGLPTFELPELLGDVAPLGALAQLHHCFLPEALTARREPHDI